MRENDRSKAVHSAFCGVGVVMSLSILIPHMGWSRGWRSLVFAAAVVVSCLQGDVVAQGEVTDFSEFDQKKALEIMRSSDAGTRALAYGACRKLGEKWKPSYRDLLKKAAAAHREKIEKSISLATDEANRFSGTLSKLGQQRNFALDYTLTDHEGEALALTELQRAHNDARFWLKETRAQHGRAVSSMARISSSSTAIDEIRRELGYCDGKAAVVASRTFNRVLSKYSTVASNLHDRLREQAAFGSALKQNAKAMEFNRAQTWATAEMRAFTDLLNDRRQVLGLPLLRLEKRLSAASSKHSKEMVTRKYFSHRSPVTENSTPERRAENVKYQGTFVGENIFFYGSPRRARAAFDGWWKSDGHRFVMFDPKSDQIGLSSGPATHWTMMTGMAPERVEVKAVRVD